MADTGTCHTPLNPEIIADQSVDDKLDNDKTLEPLAATALRDELAAMHFEAIKLRTYRGAMRAEGRPDVQQGIPAWINDIRAASGEFAAAATVLSATQMASVDWPSLPTNVLVDEIRNWWDGTRSLVAKRARLLSRRGPWRDVAHSQSDRSDWAELVGIRR